MYMRDRTQAGELLANQLMHYRYENTSVLALSVGGVMVGEQIARQLHSSLQLLVTERISAPGDESLVIGTIDQEGGFSYNGRIPSGDMEEYLMDMRNFIEEEKLHKLYDMSRLVGEGGTIDRSQLKGRHVILVTDGVKTGLSYEAAAHFLKPIAVESVIAAVPVGPADTMEHVRQLVDELHYLYIPDNFINVHHYYEDNTIADPQEVMNTVVSRWI